VALQTLAGLSRGATILRISLCANAANPTAARLRGRPHQVGQSKNLSVTVRDRSTPYVPMLTSSNRTSFGEEPKSMLVSAR